MSARQEFIDAFYFKHGPCCAGCDWWCSVNSIAGECRKSKPVPAADRYAMLGMQGCSAPMPAGHVLTPRDHYCGDFKDDFDWSSLPLPYRLRVGEPTAKRVR